jgi:dolichyl-phosphate beta-glucosyltransferase
MKLSIIIPAYNEEKRIKPTIHHILETFDNYKLNKSEYEIIIVNDGSKDQTYKIIKELSDENENIKIIDCYKNSGKGKAIRLGVAKANGDILVIYDADAATPAKFIIEYSTLIQSGAYDIIIGSRELGLKLNYDVSYYKFRRLSGRIFTLLSKIVITGYKDTQCGFKLFKNEVGKRLFSMMQESGYAWDVELLALAKIFSYKVKEVPIDWHHKMGSKINMISDSISMIFQLLKIKKRLLFVKKHKWIKGDSCIICGCNYWKLIKKIDKWSIIQCGTCKVLSLHPKLKESDLYSLYDKDYFLLGDKTAGYHDYIIWRKFIEKTANKRLSIIEQYVSRKGKLLEIGCATGYFLKVAAERGWEVKGIEISQWAAKAAIQLIGSDKIINSSIENAFDQLRNTKYDVIVAWDVFEHIIQPDILLDNLHNTLMPGGIFAFTTPNSEGFLAKAYGSHWHNFDKVPEHLYFFGKSNLLHLLHQKGFKILNARSHGKHTPLGFLLGRIFDLLYLKLNFIKQNRFLNKIGFYCNPTDIIFIICKKI